MPSRGLARLGFWTTVVLLVGISVVWVTSHFTYVWATPADGSYGLYVLDGVATYNGNGSNPWPTALPWVGAGSQPPPGTFAFC